MGRPVSFQPPKEENGRSSFGPRGDLPRKPGTAIHWGEFLHPGGTTPLNRWILLASEPFEEFSFDRFAFHFLRFAKEPHPHKCLKVATPDACQCFNRDTGAYSIRPGQGWA